MLHLRQVLAKLLGLAELLVERVLGGLLGLLVLHFGLICLPLRNEIAEEEP